MAQSSEDERIAELEEDMLRVARAIGVYYAAEGHNDAPGPTDDIVRYIEQAVRDAGHRHELEARAEQANATTRRLREALVRLRDFIGPYNDPQDGFGLACRDMIDAALAASPTPDATEGTTP